MRLTSKERQIIVEAIYILDSDATIYLFGSRVNDQIKGGDIDLLVISDRLGFKDLLKIRRRILDQIGWQQLDLLIRKKDELNQPFVMEAIETGRELE